MSRYISLSISLTSVPLLAFVLPFCVCHFYLFFFFNDTATTEIYTLSLHDALPISLNSWIRSLLGITMYVGPRMFVRSEEHTSELQSRPHLVCRLLLEKKKN